MSTLAAETLSWSSDYELGHSIVDAQHRRLFQLYSAVSNAFNRGTGYEVVGPALGRLVSYTQRHFHDEEELMAELGYSGLAEHRKQHEELVRQVGALAADLEQGEPVMIYEVLSFLADWLTNHILDEDMKIKACIHD